MLLCAALEYMGMQADAKSIYLPGEYGKAGNVLFGFATEPAAVWEAAANDRRRW
jgi:hypothetical protein